MKYDIFLSDTKLDAVVQLPMLPEKLPEVSREFNNEEFETYNNGYYNLLGNTKLATFTLESFFPEYVGKYQFEKSKSTWNEFLTILAVSIDYKEPLRIIFGEDDNSVMDAKFTIEKFSYYVDKARDYQYSVEFKEYRQVDTNVI